jgi:hypothetical protein
LNIRATAHADTENAISRMGNRTGDRTSGAPKIARVIYTYGKYLTENTVVLRASGCGLLAP